MVSRGRNKVGGGRNKVSRGRNKVGGGRNKVSRGRNKVGGGRNKVGGGRNKVSRGRNKVGGGRNKVGRGRKGQVDVENDQVGPGGVRKCPPVPTPYITIKLFELSCAFNMSSFLYKCTQYK